VAMEKEREAKKQKPKRDGELDEAEQKLASPPKDKREVTIGPTTSTGPDITVG
jgi:hypothetical protein